MRRRKLNKKISETQLEVFRLLAQGKRPKEIRHRRMTVHEHCRRVRVKLGAKTTLQAAVMLACRGIIQA